jgi:hypothetical protein
MSIHPKRLAVVITLLLAFGVPVSQGCAPAFATTWRYFVVSTPDIVGDFQGNAPTFRPPTPVQVVTPTVGRQPDSAGQFEAIVDANGSVTFEHSVTVLHEIDAARVSQIINGWRFTPATLDGTPIRVRLRIQVINDTRK